MPDDCTHNGHIYYLLLKDADRRGELIAALAEGGVRAPFHYLPLHAAPAGIAHGRVHGSMEVTNRAGRALFRLPLWVGLDGDVDTVIACVNTEVRRLTR